MLIEDLINLGLTLHLHLAHTFLMILEALLLGHQAERAVLFEDILEDNLSLLNKPALLIYQVDPLGLMDPSDDDIPAEVQNMDHMAIVP